MTAPRQPVVTQIEGPSQAPLLSDTLCDLVQYRTLTIDLCPMLAPAQQPCRGKRLFSPEQLTSSSSRYAHSIRRGQDAHRSLLVVLKQIERRQHGESVCRPRCALRREIAELHPSQCWHLEGGHVRHLTLPQMNTVTLPPICHSRRDWQQESRPSACRPHRWIILR